ncbi:MAG: hypothetical protein AAGA54_29865 [Myxococcota bacterium]
MMRTLGRLGAATIVALSLMGCRRAPDANQAKDDTAVSVGYLEIVTPEVDATCSLYERMHGLSFGPPVEAMGNARTARKPDGILVGIRAPLAAHEQPIVRAYLAVDDIKAAVASAEEGGAMVAYPPTAQGEYGTFAIVIHDGVQHGLWAE